MTLDADVLILGGGCAGLSLATALAERAPRLRVHVVEARERYTRDRTWCFWDTEPHPFTAGVTHGWNSWRVRHGSQVARQCSRRYTYQHLPADRFYEIATAAMERAGHVLTMGTQTTAQTGTEVNAARERHGICEVETSLGVLRSRWVFDSRPRISGNDSPTLVQRFLGWHVRTGRGCFDPSVVDLMDFQPTTQAGRTTFFYVLPFSPNEALVEATFFDDPAMPPACAEDLLRQYMEVLDPCGYQVLYTEAAVLPMGGHASSPSQGRVFEIGTRGGRVKPSSGYAFLRIQRQSAALAAALASGASPPSHFEAPWYGSLDRIFLRALKRSPDLAPTYFMQMFRHLPPDILVRFLSETASAREALQVMCSLPKLDFLRAAVLPTLSPRKELTA